MLQIESVSRVQESSIHWIVLLRCGRTISTRQDDWKDLIL